MIVRISILVSTSTIQASFGDVHMAELRECRYSRSARRGFISEKQLWLDGNVSEPALQLYVDFHADLS